MTFVARKMIGLQRGRSHKSHRRIQETFLLEIGQVRKLARKVTMEITLAGSSDTF